MSDLWTIKNRHAGNKPITKTDPTTGEEVPTSFSTKKEAEQAAKQLNPGDFKDNIIVAEPSKKDIREYFYKRLKQKI